MQPRPQGNRLMSKHRVLSFKPQLRLEWRGQDGQNETEQPDHSASLGDSITSSTRIRFLVHTGVTKRTIREGHPMPHPAKPASTKNPVVVAVGLPDAPVLTTRAARGTGMAFLELNCERRNAGI